MELCRLLFLSTGCNRTPHVLSWGSNGLIAFGGCNSVYVYCPMVGKKIIATLNGHSSRVNCTCWINDNELVSGSTDKTSIIWTRTKGNKWVVKQRLTGHTNAVVAVAACNYDNKAVVATSSSDSSVKVWLSKTQEYTLLTTLLFGSGFALSLAMRHLSSTSGVLLACGCDDCSIKLYTNISDDINEPGQFKQVLTLKGHEDWIQCLSFTRKGDGILLASGSQDSYIRLWSVTTTNQTLPVDTLTVKKQTFKADDKEYTVTLESVLIGHDNWVYGLSWYNRNDDAILLSASMDRSLIVWQYDEESQVWVDKARMGDVGGNTLGFYGCAISPCGTKLVAHGYQGALQMWDRRSDDFCVWKPDITITGHFESVEDFDWDPEGLFFISTSVDQTTRLFAPWLQKHKESWYEIARPQIHGYDMKCVAMLNRYTFAACAQEKITRVFSAPKAFHETLSHICNVQCPNETLSAAPLGATIPVLGLSNKAVYQDDLESWHKNEAENAPIKASTFANDDPAPFNPAVTKEPPFEDTLLQNTLWPEVHKLYGHGYELFCLAASPKGDVLATACKATKQEHAKILIWNTTTWEKIDSLTAHALTVTQLAFSPDGCFLLSVSRDRTWAVHERTHPNSLSLLQKTDKKSSIHTRIIWSCAWFNTPCYFATASRDKKVIVWKRDKEWCTHGPVLELKEPATAVSVAHRNPTDGCHLIAVGMETGDIRVYTWHEEYSWRLIIDVPNSVCATLSIKRLRWRPHPQHWHLGVASSDHTCRIIAMCITTADEN